MRYNEMRMSALQVGTMYSEGYGLVLVSDSRPEGFAMENHWGHDDADTCGPV